MIKGILIFENGTIQQIGELTTLNSIIVAIKQILPELEEQEKKRVLDSISDDDIQQLLASRKNTTEKK